MRRSCRQFLFRETATYRNADDVSAQSEVTAFEATETGYAVEFQNSESGAASRVAVDETAIKTGRKALVSASTDLDKRNL